MENQRPTPPSDELDLAQIFAAIGKGFRDAWLGFMRFLALLRRTPFENKLSFTLIIITSVIVGLLFTRFVRKNYYESTMILSSDYLNKRLAENTISKLDLLASEPGKQGLAKALNLSDTLAKNIIGFSVKPFVAEGDVIELEVLKEQLRSAQASSSNKEVIEQVIERIEIENRHAFEITVRTLSPAVIPNLQNAIVGYLERTPYISKRIEINNENLKQKQKKLREDISKLDSLKDAMYDAFRLASQNRGSNNVILSDKPASSPMDVYNTGLSIYAQYEKVSKDVFLRKDFEIVDGFTEFSEPASTSEAKMIFYALLIGVVAAYLDVALRNFNKYLATLN